MYTGPLEPKVFTPQSREHMASVLHERRGRWHRWMFYLGLLTVDDEGNCFSCARVAEAIALSAEEVKLDPESVAKREWTKVLKAIEDTAEHTEGCRFELIEAHIDFQRWTWRAAGKVVPRAETER